MKKTAKKTGQKETALSGSMRNLEKLKKYKRHLLMSTNMSALLHGAPVDTRFIGVYYTALVVELIVEERAVVH